MNKSIHFEPTEKEKAQIEYADKMYKYNIERQRFLAEQALANRDEAAFKLHSRLIRTIEYERVQDMVQRGFIFN